MSITKIEISVGEYEIQNGVRQNGSSCAIALAIRDVFPHAFVSDNSYVYPFFREFKRGESSMSGRIQLPQEVCNFIKDFDNEEDVEPIKFVIDVPDQVLNQVVDIDDVKALLASGKHPTLKLQTA